MGRPRVELLASPDCPHADAARVLVERALAAEGIAAPVRVVTVRTLDDAESEGFRGSPTIRVDGRDVDPPAPETPVHVGCRLYGDGSGGPRGIPAEDRVRDALRRATRPHRSAPPTSVDGGPGPGISELPARVLRGTFLWASRRDALRRIATGTGVTRALVERFVAGEDLDAAVHALERLRDAGFSTTVDVLGESVSSQDEARAAADRYVQTLDVLSRLALDRNVSLKLTQMGLDIDREFCRENVARVVTKAAETGAFVRIDMEDHTRTDATLEIAHDLRRDHPDVGVVIQSYLKRSAADVEELIGEGVRVRLCKGAYDEPPTVAFATKAEVDESYRVLMERLLTDGTYPALATHDERLIDHARGFADRHAIAPSRFEFQMLYGVRRDLQRRLVRDGYTVRVYVPYGSEWYPYFMRRLAERPANVMFVLRSVLSERRGDRAEAA